MFIPVSVFLVVFWILRLFATAWFVLKKTISKYDSMAIQGGGKLQEKQKKLEEYMAMPISYLAGGCKFTESLMCCGRSACNRD